MRARMAIRFCNIKTELREVVLKNKPATMLEASSKATVPVLICTDNTVIDESIEIMQWALEQHEPQNWIQAQYQHEILHLIQHNDNIFKIHLDHYKYSDRFPLHPQLHYRNSGEQFLQQLESQLEKHKFLVSDYISLADTAIFPFIRQFAYVDIQWFESSPYPKLRDWLNFWLESDLFLSIMHKQPAWQEGQLKTFV